MALSPKLQAAAKRAQDAAEGKAKRPPAPKLNFSAKADAAAKDRAQKKADSKSGRPSGLTEVEGGKSGAPVGVDKLSPKKASIYQKAGLAPDPEDMGKPRKAVRPAGSADSKKAFQTPRPMGSVASYGKALKQNPDAIAERKIAASSDPDAARKGMAAQAEIDKDTHIEGGRNNPIFKRAGIAKTRKNFPALADEIPTGVSAPKSGSGAGGGRAARGGKAAASVEHVSENADPKVRMGKNRAIATAYHATQVFTQHAASSDSKSLSAMNGAKSAAHAAVSGMPVSDLKGLQVPCIGNNCTRTVPADSETLTCGPGGCNPHSASTKTEVARTSENGMGRKPVKNKDTQLPSGREVPWSSGSEH